MSHSTVVSTVQPKGTRTALGALLVLGLALPVSTALVNVALLVLLVCVAMNFRALPVRATLREPSVYVPLVLFALLALSLLWSSGGTPSDYVSKYRKLIFIVPLVFAFVLYEKAPLRFATGFMIGVAISVVASCYVYFSGDLIGYSQVGNATVLKKEITHNFFVAAAVLGLLFMIYENRANRRAVWVAALVLAMLNIYVMVDGRTGQAALLPALLVFCACIAWRHAGVLRALCIVAIVGAIAAAFWLVTQSSFVQGVDELRACVNAWQTEQPIVEFCSSSMGARTSFWFTVMNTIQVHPLGIGVGGFPEKVVGYHNPHSDYLLYTLQLGWLGLALYVAWYARVAWIALGAGRLMPLLLSLITLFAVGNVFNSFTLDFNEGNVFVVLMAYIASLPIAKTSQSPAPV